MVSKNKGSFDFMVHSSQCDKPTTEPTKIRSELTSA